ncbi:MAG: methyltransferase domain-containing protein [Paraperlucidibaca sp.]
MTCTQALHRLAGQVFETDIKRTSWQATVARHFQRAATTYADVSALQQASAHDLLIDCRAQGVVLELGAGQGELASILAARAEVSALIALDVSEAMLRAAPAMEKLQRVVASALAIPLQDHSVDTVLSHFAVHWCLAPAAVAAEMHRVLRLDGVVQLAIPVAGSLAPLHGAAGDGALLLPAATWQQAFAATGESKAVWACEAATVKTYTRYFATAAEWLAYLRAMGVTAKPQAQAGLAGKQAYRAIVERLMQAAEPSGIPFSFQVWHARFRAC